MRFLVTTRARDIIPPEMAPRLIGAMREWLAQEKARGRLREVWSFAGVAGGGGIADVDTPEALDELMAGWPFGPFYDIEVRALSDLDHALDATEAAIARMAQLAGAGV